MWPSVDECMKYSRPVLSCHLLDCSASIEREMSVQEERPKKKKIFKSVAGRT